MDGTEVSHTEMSWLVSTGDVCTHFTYSRLGPVHVQPIKTLCLFVFDESNSYKELGCDF